MYNHGKAVTLDVSPVWPAKPTCGGADANQTRYWSGAIA